MFKFFVRFFIVVVISLCLAYQLVDKGLGKLFKPTVDEIAYQSLRGQVYELHQRLDGVAPAEREAALREQVLPHYGLLLRLLRQDQVRLSGNEREQLESQGFVMRDEYNTHLVPLPGEPAQWLEVRLPGEGLVDTVLTWTLWTFLTVMVGVGLLALWALPMWRDMDRLRNAAVRMGQGDLDIRVHLSRITGIRHVGESFNAMASRIATLIENQRSLTNAVSHELRTPLARLSFEVDVLDRSGLPREHGRVLRDMLSLIHI